MGYARTSPTVYAVWWPTINVFKVGSSDVQRWRPFLLRGAELLGLITDFPLDVSCYDFEDACHTVLRDVARPGFNTARESAPYLGRSGGGYRECYRVPGDLMPTEILPFIDTQLAQYANA